MTPCERARCTHSAPNYSRRATLNLHAHQRDAARLACEGRSYVVTTGTGSGKSLTYILPSVDYMGTFPIVRRKDLAAHGSYRTKEAILSVYDGLLGLERLSEYYSRVPGGDVAGGGGHEWSSPDDFEQRF